MIREMYVIQDKLSGNHFDPILFRQLPDSGHDKAVQAWFDELCKELPKQTRGERQATDYSLFHVGSLDSLSGVVTPCEKRFICDGVNVENL